ncbi:MAG: protein kinase [Acidobacteria bacterium]|nr:protein kinase [Acidobacteriota bacterium]
MRLNRRPPLVAALFLLLTAAAAVGAPPPALGRISLEEGLSQSSVNAVLQDRDGFLWIGTGGGLNRYDGQRVRPFKRDVRNPKGLSNNIVLALCQDRDGFLWVGTETGGLNRFDPLWETFSRPITVPGGRRAGAGVTALAVDAGGGLWVGTVEGTGRFDPRSGQPLPAGAAGEALRTRGAGALCVDRAGNVWVGSGAEVLRCAPGGRLSVFAVPAGPSGRREAVQSLAEAPGADLWVGTAAGLFRLSPGAGAFTPCRARAAGGTASFGASVTCLLTDRSGRTWVGTRNSLHRIPRGGTVVEPVRLAGVAGIDDEPGVHALFEDRSGVIWVGTLAHGLLKYVPSREVFDWACHEPSDPRSLPRSMVLSLFEGRDGTFWVGTSGSAPLTAVDLRTGETRPGEFPGFPAGDGARFPVYVVRESRADPGVLWVGTGGSGLYRFDRRRKTLARVPLVLRSPDGRTVTADHVWALHEDEQGTLWVGTADAGLVRAGPGGGAAERVPLGGTGAEAAHPPAILCLHASASEPGVLWVGTAGAGLVRLEKAGGRRLRFRHDPLRPGTLSDDAVAAILEPAGRPGELWLGTADGLNRLEKASGRFKSFGAAEGLADTSIAGVLEDQRGFLWVGTLKGLTRFDPRTGRVRNYDARDGVRVREFNRNACWKSAAGRMAFGGVNGVVSFDPESVKDNPVIPPVVLTSFRVRDREMRFRLGRPPYRGTVELSHDENVLGFEFAALDYRAPEKNRYACCMEGLDTGWVDCGTRPFARYPGMPPGEYRFRVRGSNNDGVWDPEGVSVRIVVHPPFWRTGWFMALAVVLFAFVSYGLLSLAQRYAMLIAFWRRRGHIGRWRIVDTVGRGGCGTVYRAVHPKTGRVAAVKVLDRELVDEEGRKRFVREGLICERLSHPCVVKVFERGEAGGQLYYAMDFVEGITLKAWVAERRPDVRTAAGLASVLLDLLDDFHRVGIIHRDFKPENIMLLPERAGTGNPEGDPAGLRERVRILDFGIAKILGDITLTRTSLLSGTLQYIPPEHLFGKRVRDPNYDFYSFGVILYEMLTGELPYRAGESFETLAAILSEPVPSPRELNPAVPEGLSGLVLELIARKPSDRLRQYGLIRKRLDAVLADLEVTDVPPEPAAPPPRETP